MLRRSLIAIASLCLVAAGVSVPAAGQPESPPIDLRVDLSRAVQGLAFVHETIPVAPGPLTLVYPKWIPGEHAPNGPIGNLAGLTIAAGGQTLAWRRDLVDLYAFHVDVPPGTTSLDVAYEYLGAQTGLNSANRLSTPNIFTLT